MSQTGLQRRVNAIFSRQAGGQQRPAFHEMDQTCPSLHAMVKLFLTRILWHYSEEVRAIRANLKRYG